MNGDVMQQAAMWHAVQGRDDMDWPAFTAWLAQDPTHRLAFDEIALLDDRIDEYAAQCRRNDDAPPGMPSVSASRGPRPFARWGVAAATVMAVAAGSLVIFGPESGTGRRISVYRAGVASRTIQLGDGVAATLAAGSVLNAAAGDAQLTLSGRALFDVRHDTRRPLLVVASGFRIRDVGTRFEVATGAGMVRIAVAKGRIAVTPPTGGASTPVTAGRAITGLADGRMIYGRAAATELGTWRSGPFVYDEVPLGIVAADIGRAIGKPVRIDSITATQQFSGVVMPTSANIDQTLRAIIGPRWGRDGGPASLPDRAPR